MVKAPSCGKEATCAVSSVHVIEAVDSTRIAQSLLLYAVHRLCWMLRAEIFSGDLC